MRAAADAADYRADPVGAYLVAARALVFCARPTLWGFALWGRPSQADLRRIVPLLELELAATTEPHASLVDARHLEAGDPQAFAVLASYLRANHARFGARVTRLALVRPPGVLGATVAGFFQVEHPPYAVRVFDHLATATTWLRARDLARELDASIAAATGISPRLAELRAWLEPNLAIASVETAAKAMARASRSLQRDLRAAGTTFQRELDGARIRVAQRLLIESDAPLTEIAYDVGCASPQHFSTLFRRVTGDTPSGWRARPRRNAERPAPRGSRPRTRRRRGVRV